MAACAAVGLAYEPDRARAQVAGSRENGAAQREALQRSLEKLRGEYQAIEWPQETAAEIGRLLKHDPNACSAFIRGAVRYEPYRGVLRGSDGVLASGGGNSADVCLLLQALLRDESSPTATRFAVATLSADQAKALVDKAAEGPPAVSAIAVKPPRLGTQSQEPESENDKAQQPEENQPADPLFHDALQDLRQLQAAVEENLRGLSVDRDEAVAAAREHVWLQVKLDDRWETFDPAAGLALPADNVEFLDELPAEWQHQVELKCEIERLSGEAASREKVFERAWNASELTGKAIEFLVLPEMSLPKLFDPKADNGSILKQAARYDTFQVFGLVDGKLQPWGPGFDLAGRLVASRTNSTIGVGGFDPFKRIGGSEPKKPLSELSAVWLTVTVRSPGHAPQSVERALLDRIGADARALDKRDIDAAWRNPLRVQTALIQRHQLLATASATSSLAISRRLLESLVQHPWLERSLELRTGSYRGSLPDAVADLSLPDVPLDLVVTHDSALSLAQTWLAGEGICFLATPNLYIHSEQLDWDSKEQPVFRDQVDIAINRLRVLGRGSKALEAKLLHGILASEMEGRALEGRHGAEATNWAAQTIRLAASQNIAIRPLRSADDLASIEASPAVKRLMSASLARKELILAPAHPVEAGDRPRMAWWRLDAEGNVIAVGEDGRGQTASEGVLILKEISIPMVRRCMKFVACLNAGVAAGGNVNSVAAECLGNAIRDTVSDSVKKAGDKFVKDPIKNNVANARRNMLGADANKFYERGEQAWDYYKKARDAANDPFGQAPGVNEGRAAANAGREIGASLADRVYKLLANGGEIAQGTAAGR